MAKAGSNRWDGVAMLVLLVAATGLSWLFNNPFNGFIIIFVAGVAVLAVVEYLHRRRRSDGRSPPASAPSGAQQHRHDRPDE